VFVENEQQTKLRVERGKIGVEIKVDTVEGRQWR